MEGITHLNTAARTSSTLSSKQTNYYAKGARATLEVEEASGTGGLVVQFRGMDPKTGESYTLNEPPVPVTMKGKFVYEIFPLQRYWDICVTQIDASSYTYSLKTEPIE